MTTWWGKIWKHCPYEAEKDGRMLLRIGDQLYHRTLVRVEGGPELPFVLAELGRRYGDGSPLPPEALTSGSLWIFELAPRSLRVDGYEVSSSTARAPCPHFSPSDAPPQ